MEQSDTPPGDGEGRETITLVADVFAVLDAHGLGDWAAAAAAADESAAAGGLVMGAPPHRDGSSLTERTSSTRIRLLTDPGQMGVGELTALCDLLVTVTVAADMTAELPGHLRRAVEVLAVAADAGAGGS